MIIMMTSCCVVVLKAFYSKFYLPEKDLHPEEVENTDKLSRALVVRITLVGRSSCVDVCWRQPVSRDPCACARACRVSVRWWFHWWPVRRTTKLSYRQSPRSFRLPPSPTLYVPRSVTVCLSVSHITLYYHGLRSWLSLIIIITVACRLILYNKMNFGDVCEGEAQKIIIETVWSRCLAPAAQI